MGNQRSPCTLCRILELHFLCHKKHCEGQWVLWVHFLCHWMECDELYVCGQNLLSMSQVSQGCQYFRSCRWMIQNQHFAFTLLYSECKAENTKFDLKMIWEYQFTTKQYEKWINMRFLRNTMQIYSATKCLIHNNFFLLLHLRMNP